MHWVLYLLLSNIWNLKLIDLILIFISFAYVCNYYIEQLNAQQSAFFYICIERNLYVLIYVNKIWNIHNLISAA